MPLNIVPGVLLTYRLFVSFRKGCCGPGNSTSAELSDRRPWQGMADFVNPFFLYVSQVTVNQPNPTNRNEQYNTQSSKTTQLSKKKQQTNKMQKNARLRKRTKPNKTNIYTEKNPRSKEENQPTTNSTHRAGPELNPGHIGGRRALSPLRLAQKISVMSGNAGL